jgi:site-specific recombinase XerC
MSSTCSSPHKCRASRHSAQTANFPTRVAYLGDYNAETTELRVRSGKGQKDRLCYVTDGAKLALDIWLAARGNEPGPLFWPADGRGRPLVNRRMTD